MLWARSYWWREAVATPTFVILSQSGELRIAAFRENGNDRSFVFRKRIHWFENIDAIEDDPLVLDAANWESLAHFSYGQPIWMTAVLCGLTWIIPLRFSLRTLLIAITLICVVAGFVMWSIR